LILRPVSNIDNRSTPRPNSGGGIPCSRARKKIFVDLLRFLPSLIEQALTVAGRDRSTRCNSGEISTPLILVRKRDQRRIGHVLFVQAGQVFRTMRDEKWIDKFFSSISFFQKRVG